MDFVRAIKAGKLLSWELLGEISQFEKAQITLVPCLS